MSDNQECIKESNQKINIGSLARLAIDDLGNLRETIEKFPDPEMRKRCICHILEITQEVKDSYEKLKTQ